MKLFHLFVFTDWNGLIESCIAFEKLKDTRSMRGYFCFIDKYNDEVLKAGRKKFTFEELVEAGQEGKIGVNEIPFSNFEEYKNSIEFLKKKNLFDVFGIIQKEIL